MEGFFRLLGFIQALGRFIDHVDILIDFAIHEYQRFSKSKKEERSRTLWRITLDEIIDYDNRQ
jgi:hypothetical protein